MRLQLFSLLATLVLFIITGCNPHPSADTRSASTSIVITVVGDESAPLVVQELTKHGFQIVPTLDNQTKSSVIVVVQDSTVGPSPIHLEIAKSLPKRPAEDYLWVFTNTALVDDQELLELEELECREVFNRQQLPGDEVVFGFDSATARVSPTYDCPRGWSAIARHIRNVAN